MIFWKRFCSCCCLCRCISWDLMSFTLLICPSVGVDEQHDLLFIVNGNVAVVEKDIIIFFNHNFILNPAIFLVRQVLKSKIAAICSIPEWQEISYLSFLFLLFLHTNISVFKNMRTCCWWCRFLNLWYVDPIFELKLDGVYIHLRRIIALSNIKLRPITHKNKHNSNFLSSH